MNNRTHNFALFDVVGGAIRDTKIHVSDGFIEIYNEGAIVLRYADPSGVTRLGTLHKGEFWSKTFALFVKRLKRGLCVLVLHPSETGEHSFSGGVVTYGGGLGPNNTDLDSWIDFVNWLVPFEEPTMSLGVILQPHIHTWFERFLDSSSMPSDVYTQFVLKSDRLRKQYAEEA